MKSFFKFGRLIQYDILCAEETILFFWCQIAPFSESPHSEPGTLDEVDNGPNTSDEGE